MTQMQLGLLLGFPERSAEIRISQYESGARKPKEKVAATIAKVLGVSPLALYVPEINNPLRLLHTLFALEDTYGEWIEGHKGTITLHFDPYNNQDAAQLFTMLCDWHINIKNS